jgi:hypothetical protein
MLNPLHGGPGYLSWSGISLKICLTRVALPAARLLPAQLADLLVPHLTTYAFHKVNIPSSQCRDNTKETQNMGSKFL